MFSARQLEDDIFNYIAVKVRNFVARTGSSQEYAYRKAQDALARVFVDVKIDEICEKSINLELKKIVDRFCEKWKVA